MGSAGVHHIGELQKVHFQLIHQRNVLVLGSYISRLDIEALIGVVIHPYITKLYKGPGSALGLEYYSMCRSVLL